MVSISVITLVLLSGLYVGVRGGESARERHKKIKQSIARYKGPVYKPSSWKTTAGAATLYGLASYKRRSLYYYEPDKEPTVCFNTMDLKEGTFAYFICPMDGMKDEKNLCCNIEGEEECCSNHEKTWGATMMTVFLFGGIALFIIIIIGWLVKKSCG